MAVGFAVALALGKIGDALWARVGREPSGSAFNSIVQLEYEHGVPRNPFINAGAIVLCDVLLAGRRPRETIGEILQFFRFLANDYSIAIDPVVAAAEKSTGYRNVALPGDYGIAWLLTRLVGTSRARELMFTAERVTAVRGEQIGLVNRVVPDEKLQEEAFALAKSMAEGPAIALRYMKDNLDEALAFDFATARDHEAERMIRAQKSADHREAVQAFIDKRKPAFVGK